MESRHLGLAPKEIFNRTLYLSILVFGVLGSARGYDGGNISGTLAQVSFKENFDAHSPHKSKDEVANLKSNIAAGAIGIDWWFFITMYTVDRLGRIRALQQVCIIWIIAAVIQITSKCGSIVRWKTYRRICNRSNNFYLDHFTYPLKE